MEEPVQHSEGKGTPPSKKTVWTLVGLVLLLLGVSGYLFWKSRGLSTFTQAEVSVSPSSSPAPSSSPSPSLSPSPNPSPTPTMAVTSATATVDPSTYSDTCPKVFTFNGKITSNGGGTVKYVWERSDGTMTSEKSLVFASAGTQAVSDTWSRNNSESGWARIKVVTPNAFSSAKATYTLSCVTARDFSGSWYHNFGTANITQTGASVVGTYTNGLTGVSGTVAGTVSGNTLTGTWSISGGSGALTWIIDDGGNSFGGNWSGSNNWCGAKAGKQFPDNCGFQGSWNARVGSFYPCSMSLNQTNATVSGTYCNGTVTGTISYAGGETKLTGNWVIGDTHGGVTFYLLGYDGKQFQGNYDTTYRWCGWRASSSEPGTCLK